MRKVEEGWLSVAAVFACGLAASVSWGGAGAPTEGDFVTPPASAKPHTWYHMMNGNVTKEGITRDFEALAEAGFGGVQMFDAGCGIPPGGLDFNTPAWFDMFKHAAAEARRLGLEICIPNCSGWSSSGGPWNPPSNGMKRVVFTETRAKGPSRFRAVLPRTKNDNGFYDDIAVLAFPTPPAELVAFPDVKTAVAAKSFTFSSPKPFTMSGFSYQLNLPWLWSGDATLKVESSEDGQAFRELETFTVPLARSGGSDTTLRFRGFTRPVTVRALRVTVDGGRINVSVKTARPEAKMSLSGLHAKTFGVRHEVEADPTVATADQTLKLASVRDVTSRMKADGTLDWDVPAGDWTILRVGYVCNGRQNGPASKYGVGLEVDKLSATALDYHFEQYVGRLCRTLGPLAGKVPSGFNNILVDSYEVGSQNWTKGLEDEFRRRRGYDLKPYLPVFAGHVIGSVAESERVLEDFRRVVADLFAENYSGALTKKCHQYGLLCSIEPYGSCPADNLQYGQYVDIPMCEFWSNVSEPYSRSAGNARYVSFVAHVWGKRICGAEAFTGAPGPNGGRWQTTPFHIKHQGDVAFADGVNRLIYHRFAHQPWADDKYLPGMTMGMWGMHLDRTQTWWPLAKPFFRYQARCQYMLQCGTFVADALFFTGEAAPNQGGNTDGSNGKVGDFAFRLPEGYAYDVCPTDAMALLKVEDGEIVAPGGVRYRMLVIPPVEAMTPKMLAQIARVQKAGAKIVWSKKPTRTLGLDLTGKADAEVRRLADEVFAAGVLAMSPVDALSKLGVPRQVDWKTDRLPSGVGRVFWLHRRAEGAEWFFTAVPARAPAEIDLSFRIRGKVPELWDAERGTVERATVWSETGDGRTVVRVPFDVCGSKFVVFRTRSKEIPHLVTADVRAKPYPQQTAKEPGALRFLAAEYGAEGKTLSVTDRLNALAADGFINVVVNNRLSGSDPAYLRVKSLKTTYVYRGVTNAVEVRENEHLIVPAWCQSAVPPLSVEMTTGTFGNRKIWAWQPVEGTLTDEKGAKQDFSAQVPAPTPVEGAWEVSFPHGFLPNALAKGADEKVSFGKLVPWNEHADENVRYFSGRAVYRKEVKLPARPAGARVVLDLGRVCELAEVTVNGKRFDALWHPPYRVDITDALSTSQTFSLEICVANLWANRLIGDDRQFAPDCAWNGEKNAAIREIPQWVKEGKPSPTGRHTFTTWKHWNKDDKLLLSGLIGPVKLYTVVDATPKPRPNIPSVVATKHPGWAGWGHESVHAAKMKEVRAGGAPIVFLGDDLVEAFELRDGRVQWEKYFKEGRYRALNLGYRADRTENVLWRIENGELSGYAPKAIVLEVGSLNMKRSGETVLDTILGVRTLVRRLRELQPQAKVILHPILPSGEAGSPERRRIETINKELKWFADGKSVWWCDFTDQLLTADGRLLREVSQDGYHYCAYGYEVWANALFPYLDAALDWDADDGRMMPMRLTPRVDPANFGNESLAVVPVSIIGHSYPWEGHKGWWLDKVAAHRQQVVESGGKIDLVFLGDSITDNWDHRGGAALTDLRKEFSVMNLGYSGDSTQHLLWRVRNGELEGYRAKVFVLLIGTNNLGGGESGEPTNVLAGIRAILATIREKQPQAKVMLQPLLPMGYPLANRSQTRRTELNRMLPTLADGKSVILCDFTSKFLKADGTYREELYGDTLHINTAGYRIWTDSILPTVRQLAH